MKAKINNMGNFLIERADIVKRQECPFTSEGFCGDWCPLFHEPIERDEGRGIYLKLCQTEYYFNGGDFTDERGK